MKHQSPNPVHPRLRGELMTPVEFWSQVIGSSPLTWGTPRQPAVDSAPWRFIPAYAGNSLPVTQHLTLDPVHPRLRGELSYWRGIELTEPGSSPLTRGTPAFPDSSITSNRFIPAYAGNSLKQDIEHLTNSSKDFLSGKYAKNPETVLNHFKNSSLD